MKPFTTHTGIVATLNRANVDTDAIIPKQFLKSIKRTGFGPNAFFDWRYTSDGEPDADFELHQPHFEGRSILVTRNNFGCGSSREHAVWALAQYGFRSVLAPSFADIFYNNCFKNGLLPIALDASVVDQLFDEMYQHEGYSLIVDLPAQEVRTPGGDTFQFEVDAFRKHCLVEGLDDIGLTLKSADTIRDFEQRWRQESPWLFDVIK